MKDELISVVVPIYKVEMYLKQCINSIIKQTYTNLEIILVDDGSPDNCPKICDEFKEKDSRVVVIRKENGGLSDARNAGIDVAKGKYIAFIDSDDYIHNEFIEELYNHIVSEKAQISMCTIQKVNEKDEVIEEIPITEEKVISGRKAILEFNNFSISNVVAWNKLYNIELFKDIRYPKGKIHEDEFTTYKLLYLAKRVAISNRKLYYYRYNQNSITNKQFNEKRLDVIDALEERIEFFKNRNEIELYENTLNLYLGTLIYLYDIGNKNMNNSIKKMILRKYRKAFKLLQKDKVLEKKKQRYLFYYMPDFYILLKKLI